MSKLNKPARVYHPEVLRIVAYVVLALSFGLLLYAGVQPFGAAFIVWRIGTVGAILALALLVGTRGDRR